jgi:acetyl-CoA C-acetyltransferase
MSQAPHLLPAARAGYRLGDVTAVDSMIRDGLWCAFDEVHMGAGTQSYASQASISREVQDRLAATSHERAAAAMKDGRFDDEIVAVPVPQRKGDPLLMESDEGVRPDTTVETLARLKPAFAPDGTVTAGNASQISDGGAAVVVVSAAKAQELGITPRAELVSFGMVAGPDPSLLTQPSRAIRRALDKAGRDVNDVDLFEVNEAFAAVVAASSAELDVSEEIVNVNGGAIALGHPIGMSGTRLLITLVTELNRRGGGLGAAALCGGGGQGLAAIVRVTA